VSFSTKARVALAVALVLILGAAVAVVARSAVSVGNRVHLVAYFANANGIYAGDNVVLLGVPVGKIERIDPEPTRVKISFWIDEKYPVPADAKAVILSPNLVTARAIELTPAYTGGPRLENGAVIPKNRTAVPVEFDDLREQLEELANTLQPTEPGGVSTLGAFIRTSAENLRGQGADIRQTVINLAQAVSALGDHSGDLFGTLKNLAALVSALQDSSGVLGDLNRNLAEVSALFADDPDEIGNAINNLREVADDVQAFVAENRETLGITSDKLSAVTQALVESLPDIKQTLHLAPTAFQNFVNIYQPAQAALTGALALNNFSNPIHFLCGAIQAASKMNAEHAAKLCVQYLAPIIKNRQWNFPPLGMNPIVGAMARPNEITYSEDWLRPDYIPPKGDQADPNADPHLPPANTIFYNFGEPAFPEHNQPPFVPYKAIEATPADPKEGLPGLMLPDGGGR